MKVIRVLTGLILSVVLIATAGLTMCSMAVDKALSEEAISRAIEETNAVDKLTDSFLSQNTANMGGTYGNTMKAILKSDAMTEFFTAYTAKALRGAVYHENHEEIGSDELNQAFSKGIEEGTSKGSITMGEGERMIFDRALNEAMPALTEGINYVLAQMNLVDFVDDSTARQVEIAEILASPQVRYTALGMSAIICLLLIMLFRKSKAGFFWCSFNILILAILMFIVSTMLSGTMASSDEFISLSTRMLYVMTGYGLEHIAIPAGIVGLAFIPAGFIAKAVSR